MQHQALDSEQRKCFTPAFHKVLQRSISFSMHGTVEGLVKEVDYFSSLKEGYKMTILWLADRPPLVTGGCVIAPNLNRIRMHSGPDRKPWVSG